jgi:CRP/FNR family transcriptional regulator
LGLALETVSRLLGRFESAEMIKVKGKFIHILDMNGLRKASGEFN